MSSSRLIAWLFISAVLAASALPSGAVESAGDREPLPEVTCLSCLVVDDRGRTLYGRAAAIRRPIASTTKMVTALVVSENAGFGEEVTVSATAAATGGGGLDLAAGERYSVEDLLYALLLSSSNDAAVALAEHTAGSEAAFAAEMNSVAASLGAAHSNFVTAHGLDTAGHFSTARDLARIGGAMLDDPELAEIVATPRSVIDGGMSLENRNLLLEGYEGAIGIKTGYTRAAGNVLVGAARRRHRTVISVAMGSYDALADSRRLLDYGFRRLARTVLVPAGRPVGTLVTAAGSATPVVARRAVRGLADPERVAVEWSATPGLTAPAAGERVGTVVVSAGRHRVGNVGAVAADTVQADDAWAQDLFAGLLRGMARLTGRL